MTGFRTWRDHVTFLKLVIIIHEKLALLLTLLQWFPDGFFGARRVDFGVQNLKRKKKTSHFFFDGDNNYKVVTCE